MHIRKDANLYLCASHLSNFSMRDTQNVTNTISAVFLNVRTRNSDLDSSRKENKMQNKGPEKWRLADSAASHNKLQAHIIETQK